MSKRRKIMIEVDGYTIAVLKALLKQVDQQQVVKGTSEYAKNSMIGETRQLSFCSAE
ncbi:MAG: hypothetical protein SH847_13210 [Roseiflexaceae bacterium]|nr:hypothetical protein [Roseiflexaceae bacterium]